MCLVVESIKVAEEDLTFYKEVNIQDGKFITPYRSFPIEVGKEYTIDTDIEELANKSNGVVKAGVFHLYKRNPEEYNYVLLRSLILKTTVKKGEKYLEGQNGDVGVTRVRYECLNKEDKERYEKLMKRFPKGVIWEARSEGVLWVNKFRQDDGKSKFNLINAEGNLLSEQWFDDFKEFHEGFALVELNGEWNFIDTKGKILSKKWFDGVAHFHEGFARIYLNKRYNFIDKDGKLLTRKWFDFASCFTNGFAEVRLKGEWKAIDKDGNIVNKNIHLFNPITNAFIPFQFEPSNIDSTILKMNNDDSDKR